MSGLTLDKMLVAKQKADAVEPRVCCCVGPQNGAPACPCLMRQMQVFNGRRVIVQDFGPIDA